MGSDICRLVECFIDLFGYKEYSTLYWVYSFLERREYLTDKYKVKYG